jgi:hypothetical protein
MNKSALTGAESFAGIIKFSGDMAGGAGAQLFDLAQMGKRQMEIQAATGMSAEAAAEQVQSEIRNRQGATGSFADAQSKVAGASKDLQELSFNLVKNVVPAVDAFAGSIKRVTGFINEKFGGPTPPAPGLSGAPASKQDLKDLITGKPVSQATPESKIAPATGSKAAILDLIGKGESRGDYNALVSGKKGVAKSADLTNMTIAEVMEMQKGMIDKGHLSSAVGKYQMIRSTLGEQAKKSGLDVNSVKFDQKTQDLLAGQLVDQSGYGKKDSATVMKNLAGTWASLPKDMSGRGAYDGFNSNKAHIDPAAVMAAITNPTMSATPTGPTGGFQPQLANATPATTLPPAQQAQANNQTKAEEDKLATGFMALNANLENLVRTNQRQLAAQEKQLKQTS